MGCPEFKSHLTSLLITLETVWPLPSLIWFTSADPLTDLPGLDDKWGLAVQFDLGLHVFQNRSTGFQEICRCYLSVSWLSIVCVFLVVRVGQNLWLGFDMLACKASQQGETVVAQNMKYLKYFPCWTPSFSKASFQVFKKKHGCEHPYHLSWLLVSIVFWWLQHLVDDSWW